MTARRVWHDDSPPAALYPISERRRPHNGVVVLAAGTGTDPAAVAAALKKLRKVVEGNGTYAKLRRDSELWAFYPRGERRRRKTAKARARIKKTARHRQAFEARCDPDGRRPRRPSPPREVRTAAAG